MLLGFPLDYRSSEYLQAAIGSFGRLILWEEDRSNISRTLLRVRVTSLDEVPQFIVFWRLRDLLVTLGLFNVKLFSNSCLAAKLRMRTPSPCPRGWPPAPPGLLRAGPARASGRV
jgi:hypothetical protein